MSGNSLQETYLENLRRNRVPVALYLVNGIKLQGQIESFDQFVVMLKGVTSQAIYKRAISTIVPASAVRALEPPDTSGTPASDQAR